MKLEDWIILLVLVISLVAIWQFRQIVLLILTAVILAIALNSLVRWIQRFGIKRGRAMLMALILVLTGGILFFSLVMPPFLNQFQQLVNLVPRGWQQLLTWADQILENPPVWLPEIQIPTVPDLATWAEQVIPATRDLVSNFYAIFTVTLATLLQVLLVIVLTLMFLADPLAYRRLLIGMFPLFYRKRAEGILNQCEIALLSWMKGIAINSLFVASLSGMGLLILGIQFVLAHALMTGLFNFIPNIGPTLSLVFPVSVALLATPWKAIAVVILYLVIQNVESYWFSPMVMQRQVSLLPAATLIAQIFFAGFFGFLGLVLALPLAVIAKIWIDEVWIKDYLDRKESKLPIQDTIMDPNTHPTLNYLPRPPVSAESEASEGFKEQPDQA